jgi:G6PDH family F420-dependent oxidoreductase
MLKEAIEVIRLLWKGESVTHRGQFFTVEDARIFDLPEDFPPLVVSAFGEESARLAARKGDGLWTTGTNQEALKAYDDAGGAGAIWSQLTVSWDPDRSVAVDRAHRIWPNTGLPGQLAQDLRTVLHFEQAVKLVTPDQIQEQMPCGPDPDPILEKLAEMAKLGIDHVYLHQIGNPLDGFIDFWAHELRPSIDEQMSVAPS